MDVSNIWCDSCLVKFMVPDNNVLVKKKTMYNKFNIKILDVPALIYLPNTYKLTTSSVKNNGLFCSINIKTILLRN